MRFDDTNLAPYDGTGPYIFLSYSHKDSDHAREVLSVLNPAGYHIWYDEGLIPGKEWDEYVARRVAECGFFIALLSQNYMESSNCRDELNFARDREKPCLLIYLEDVRLPLGMEMRLGRMFAIRKDKYTEEAFLNKILTTEGLEAFRSGDADEAAPSVRPKPAAQSRCR